MVIVLTKYEKKTLFSFFALYLGSVTILLAFIAILFFNRNYENKYKQLIANMKMQAQEVCSNIIMGDMEGKLKTNFDFPKNTKFTMHYYSKEQMSTLPFTLKNKQNIYKSNTSIYYVEPNKKGTWGIDYIVLEDKEFLSNSFKRVQHCILLFGSIYLLMTFIGYVLARYFIEPIIEQRKQLNNFIKDTTHELNTPISAIVMSIQDDSKELSPKSLQRIKYSAKRIAEIYNDLSYLFLEENNKNKSFIQNYNLKDILQEQIIYFSKMAENKNQTIVFDLEDISLDIDKEDFIRLSNNLINNAIKYTQKNGHIHISLTGDYFLVKDDGIGISKENQKNIFNRFYRASKDVGGFGIGLNIVHNICNKYNFIIKLHSELNKGSEFSIRLT